MKRSILALLLPPLFLAAHTFRVASYNIENLFDLQKNGTEYTEYIPNTKYGWNEKMFSLKTDNIARVICDMKPDIIGLQEVESIIALRRLLSAVNRCGVSLVFSAIAKRKPTTVKTAVLSKYPIIDIDEIDPDSTLRTRNILEATIEIEGNRLHIFVNHWKSRSGPESRRIVSAKALARRLAMIEGAEEYILLGDFNSGWNEYMTIKSSPRLNDTYGKTGINHFLNTIKNSKIVSKPDFKAPYHYNLWLELPVRHRWSHNFHGRKVSLDHIILPSSMFDNRGINYIDGSFRVFKPSYLFTEKEERPYRWQISKKRYGKHLGKGYSDHLPIYADFSTAPFTPKKIEREMGNLYEPVQKPMNVSISELYDMPPGETNVFVKEAVVIYKKGPFAIIKEPKGRAILVYKDVDGLEVEGKYRLGIKRLYRYRGLQEVTKIDILQKLEKVDIKPLLLRKFAKLEKKKHLNEVIATISGTYRRGYLHYGKGHKVKLYFKSRKKRPKNGTFITLENIRIGFYRNRLELVID